jgi:hypothetical protein
MAFLTTEIKTEDGLVTISDILRLMRNSKEFSKVIESLENIEYLQNELINDAQKIANNLGQKVDNDDPRLDDQREPIAHQHNANDISGLFTKEEAEKLISSQIKELKQLIDNLPEPQKIDLKAILKTLRAEIDFRLSNLKPDNSRIERVESQANQLVSLIEGVIEKAENELKEVQEKLLLELSNRINEGDKQVNIIGGINIGERLKLLKDVSIENPNDGDKLTYNATSKKWEAVAGGGAVDSVNGQTGVVVLDAADVGAATTAQGALADSALQSGDNVSELVNDAGYLTSYTETDTLQTVTNRGATTTNTVTISPSGNNKALVANGSGSGIGIDITHAGSGVKLNIGAAGSGDAIRFDTDKFVVADSGAISSSLFTASTILSANASKELTSLDTATYPSLTELSYTKGLTSAIQTQLNTKIDGSLTANRVPYASDSNTLTDTPYFYYDSANSRLEVFSGLGTEKVTNGSFTGSASGWTLGSGFAYSSNSVSKTSNGTAGLTQAIGTILGEEYLIVFTISNYTAGTITPVLGIVSGTAVSANGTYSQRIVPTNTGALSFNPSNTARFTIDSVSVKRLQGGSIATDAIGIGGANSSPSTTKAMFTFSHSNTSPDTTRAVAFNNAGTGTWFDFNFSGTAKSHIGAKSDGELSLWASGANYVGFYNKATNSLMAYLTPSAFAHYGVGTFASSVGAGSGSTPSSTLQTAGSLALKVKRATTNLNLDNSATHWLLDAASASACSGTPSATCSSWNNEADCLKWDAHGGCSWNAGSDCSVYNGDQSSCEGQSGCTYATASCAGAGDESSCLSQDDSYGGNCSWDNTPQDCSGFDESACSMTSGCSVNTDYCYNYSDGGGDGTACNAANGGAFCSYDSGTGECSGGSWFSGCTGSYDNYSCGGTYYTGSCSGTYGAACSGTASCAGIDDSTNCGNETGCTWSSVLNATLPDGETCPDRTYWLYNDSTGNQDVIIYPFAGQTVNETTSYTLSSYRDWVHFAYFKKTADCSTLGNQAACEAQTGCTAALPNCSWDSMENVCNGGTGCSGYSDETSCNEATYYNGCSGTYTISKNWYKFGS